MRNYRVFLFKPIAINYAVDWNSSTYRELLLGELKVDNLRVSLKLQDISTINFDIPENIFGEINPRLDEVLDNYIIELWYGDITDNTTAIIQRFVITKSPLEYENGVKRYCYEGNSLEHGLEFKQLLSWEGVKVKDFYRTIRYDYSTDTFTENPSTGNAAPTYSLNTSSYNPGGEEQPVLYITVPTTTAATTPPSPFDIFIYQYRRNDTDTLNSETPIIEYEQNVPSGTLYQNQSGFKPGFYVPVVDANGKVTSIHIALPKDFKQFNSASKVFEIFLYDNPVSRHFAIGINTDQEIQASDMYLQLAQNQSDKFIFACSSVNGTNILTTANLPQARENLAVGQTVTGTGIPSNTKITALESRQGIINITISNNSSSTALNLLTFDSLNASEYEDYAFTIQSVYSKNGLKLEHILLGNIETRDINDDIDNTTLTEDGVLFDTGFTIGKVHDDIAVKYRSNIELNNLTKYEAIKNLAESFDAIAIFNSVTKTVSFYPDKNDEVTDFVNNGLIITQNNYLKNLTNDIDSSKIITKAYAAGKDNLSISLITPNGSNAWEDYSYFLDTYYVEYPAASGVTIANDDVNNANNNTGVKYTDFPTGTLARWIDSTEALKIAKWQYARDYFHDIMLGNLDPTVYEHDRYYDLYNLRSAAINDFVKEETEYFELKATEYKYKYLNDYYVKLNDNTTTANSREQTFVYKFSNSTTVADPTATYFRLNNASFGSVTQIVIDDLDNASINRRTFLAAITTSNNPRIMLSDTTPNNYVFYQINSADSTNTGYIILNVTYINRTAAGSTFTNNNTINLKLETWRQIYETKYTEAVAASAFALAELDKLHYNLYNTRFDGTIALSGDSDYTALVTNIQPNSYATKIIEIQGFLRKSRWDIDESKLKPFVKEAIMSDSNLDNELDLLTTTVEYLKENSQPIVTLSVDVLDFLASSQASVDWNKVKIGEIVNIYFADFNVDTTAQLREIAIDFQSNQLNFTISTYRQYTRLPATYIMRQIRKTHDIQINKVSYDYDLNRIGSNRGVLVEQKLSRIGFAAENAPIKLGAKSTDGSSSTEISGEGIVSNVITPDPILETFSYVSTKTLSIADGNLLARNVVSGSLTSEVEISGDNGLVIRSIDGSGVVTPQVYIDTSGNAIFSGFISVGQSTVGYDQTGIFLGMNSNNPKVSFKSDSTTFFKYDPSANYDLEIAGNAKIGPLHVGNNESSASTLTSSSGLTYYTGESSQITNSNSGYVTFNLVDNSGQEITGGTVTLSAYSGSDIIADISLYDGINGTGNLLATFETDDLTTIGGIGGFLFSYNIRNVKSVTISVSSINILSTWTLPIANITVDAYKPSIQINNFTVNSSGEITSSKITINTSTTVGRDTITILPATVGTTFKNMVLSTPAAGLAFSRTVRLPDENGTIALMQSTAATMYIGRIWTRSYNSHTWALRRDATLQLLPTNGTYEVFNLGYTIVDDSANADIIKVEIVGGTSSTSGGRAFVEVTAGTFQSTSGIAVLSYTAFDGVNGNIITPIQYLAQYRTNGTNFEVRRPTSIKMSGGA